MKEDAQILKRGLRASEVNEENTVNEAWRGRIEHVMGPSQVR